MREARYDSVVIGAGAAGMAAALRVAESGARVALVDREDHLGGILLQCIHNGFGLHSFKEELTGPEFAERYAGRVRDGGVDVMLDTTVLALDEGDEGKRLLLCGEKTGVMEVSAPSVVLAMGCRERNRGNLGIPGTRPAGVFTAGLAQRLLNIDGYLPGKRVVIIGSGDIGLIMARRLSWVGAEVLGVIEILPYPSGVTRNVVQCLDDFGIPLYLSHVVSHIDGRDRVEGVEVTPLENGHPISEKRFRLPCDTVLLSVGLIPENELSRMAGVHLSHETGGPRVDANLMTNLDGVFACGNVLHVHDLVDWAAEEAERCGGNVLRYLGGGGEDRVQGTVAGGANVKYVVPQHYVPGRETRFSLRPLVVRDRCNLLVKTGGAVLKKRVFRHVRPAEMIHFTMKEDDWPAMAGEAPPIELALE